MSSSSGVVAVIGAATFPNWTSYDVDADVLTPAAAFTLSVADPSPAQIAAISEGAAITLRVGATTILQGWVDEKVLQSSRGSGDILTLAGRDYTAPLVDCNVPLRWTHRRISLTQLVTLALAELGVAAAVVAHADAATLLDYVHAEPGETFWELLAREAKRLRLLLWSEPDGLHIGRPAYASAPIGTLHRHVTNPGRQLNNVAAAEITWRTSGRRSRVTVVGQSPSSDTLVGTGASRITCSATDADLVAMGLSRPAVVEDAGATSYVKARARAEWEVSRRRGEAWAGRYTVPGHGPADGQVWDIDAVVSVLDDRAGVQGPRWCSARKFSKSRDAGTTTTLTLRELNAILPAVT